MIMKAKVCKFYSDQVDSVKNKVDVIVERQKMFNKLNNDKLDMLDNARKKYESLMTFKWFITMT